MKQFLQFLLLLVAATQISCRFFNDEEMDIIQSICGKDDSVEAKCHADEFPLVYERSKAALRIQNDGRPHCTGWLVGDQGHVLTNYHCIQTQWGSNQMTFEAMAEGKTCRTNCKRPGRCSGTVIHSVPLKFIKTGGSIEKDYTLLQLAPQDRMQAVSSYGYLKLRRSGPVLHERIYIPQHPRGWGKRIAMKDGENWATVIDTNTTNFNRCGTGQVGYKADTQGGSSGSPVIGYSDNAVVAIHHCGGCSDFANTATHLNVLLEELDGLLPDSAFV